MPIGQEQSATSHATTTASSDSASDTALSWSLINEDLQLVSEFTIEIVMQYFLCIEMKMMDWKGRIGRTLM